jgi:anthranilate synthase/aminodeoxychorismate synthase-like glutamine amidotransferase
MLLMIDNYDSFTYNLVQYFYQLGQQVEVIRNDKISIEEIEKLQPEFLVISPGPCTPNEAGISVEAIKYFQGSIPILGVCLGHQCMGSAFGAEVVRSKELMHGKLSKIQHDGTGIFKEMPIDFMAARYHSLVIEPETLISDFDVNARTEDGTIMAIQHNSLPLVGLQFHPESIATDSGIQLLDNFLNMF